MTDRLAQIQAIQRLEDRAEYGTMPPEHRRDLETILAMVRELQGRVDAVSRIVNEPDWEGFPPMRVYAGPIRAAITATEGATHA